MVVYCICIVKQKEIKMQTVIFDGKEYTLTQDAYISSDGKTYQATAVDKNGDDYMVYWDVIDWDNIDEIDDESNMCDWDNAANVIKI
jgi:hypothetical protein